MSEWKFDPALSFAENRAAQLEAQGKQAETPAAPPPPPVAEMDADLVPDVLAPRTEEDDEVDAVIANIDPLTAYRKWIGKEVAENETNWEECHISCPFPSHRDSRPSAWILTKDKGTKPKGTWFCGGCQEGGDLYDMAAIHHGMSDYKSGKNFHDLRRAMAEDFGYRFKMVGGREIMWKKEEASAPTVPTPPPPAPAPQPVASTSEPQAAPQSLQPVEPIPAPAPAPAPPAPADPAASVTTLHEKDVEDEAEDDIGYPVLDWKSIVTPDTFLSEYLEATSNDDSPEEYHFWHALLALGHAAGRNVYLDDTRPVYGNLLVCLLGGTGFGKSRSRHWLDEVIEEALPYRDTGLGTTGVKLVPVPASGENLIYQFQHVAQDPSLPKGTVASRTPINGVVDYDEFAGLLARAGRQGSTLKQILMQFSDSRTRISTSSNTGGTYEAYKPFCSITASTQPKAIRPLLSRTDTASGFLNRWLFVGGPRKKREVIGGVRSTIRVDLSPSVEELKRIHAWASIERDVQFTDEGFKAYTEFVERRVFPLQNADDTDLLTRLDLTMKRLVLLFCVNEKRTQADVDVVQKLRPMLSYLVDCYTIVNAEIGVSALGEITTEILRHIKRIQEKTGRGASARDIAQRMQRKNYSPDMIRKALETMVALDWIDIEKTKGPGRPTIRYEVVVAS